MEKLLILYGVDLNYGVMQYGTYVNYGDGWRFFKKDDGDVISAYLLNTKGEVTNEKIEEAVNNGNIDFVNINDMKELDQKMIKEGILSPLELKAFLNEIKKEYDAPRLENDLGDDLDNLDTFDDLDDLDDDIEQHLRKDSPDHRKRNGLGLFIGGLAIGAGISAGTIALKNGIVINKKTTDLKNSEKDKDKKVSSLTEEQKAFLDNLNITYEVESKTSSEDLKRLFSKNDLYGNKNQKEFALDSMTLVNKFHEMTHKNDNFRLNEDKDVYLDLTWDEAVALNLVLNNYSQEQINDIFGDYELNATTIENNVKSAYNKLSIYYMNAIEPSGLGDLIKNDSDRDFFLKQERAILEFNKNPNQETANEVHRALYYGYVNPGATSPYTSQYKDLKDQSLTRRAVSFMSLTPHYGFLHRNWSTPYQVEKFLITRLDDEKEKASVNNDPAFLQSNTEYIKLLRLDTGELVIDNEIINPNYNNGHGKRGIFDLVNYNGLCVDLTKRSEEVANMIKKSNYDFQALESTKDLSLHEAKKFFESGLKDQDENFKDFLFRALGNNEEKYETFLKKYFNSQDINIAGKNLEALIKNVQQTIKPSSIKLVENEFGIVFGEDTLREISDSSQYAKQFVDLYRNLLKEINGNRISYSDIRNYAIEEIKKLPNYGGYYESKEGTYNAISYLENVRREMFTKKYIDNKYYDSLHNYGYDYDENSSNLQKPITTNKIEEEILGPFQSSAVQYQTVVIPGSRTVTQEVISEKSNTVMEEVDPSTLTEEEKKHAEEEANKEVTNNFTDDTVRNDAIKALKSYLEKGNYQFSPELIKEFQEKYGIDLTKQDEKFNILTKFKYIRGLNKDGKYQEIDTNDSQFESALDNSWQNFYNSLTSSQIEQAKAKYGENWKETMESKYRENWHSTFKESVENLIEKGVERGAYKDLYDKEVTDQTIEPTIPTDTTIEEPTDPIVAPTDSTIPTDTVVEEPILPTIDEGNNTQPTETDDIIDIENPTSTVDPIEHPEDVDQLKDPLEGQVVEITEPTKVSSQEDIIDVEPSKNEKQGETLSEPLKQTIETDIYYEKPSINDQAEVIVPQPEPIEETKAEEKYPEVEEVVPIVTNEPQEIEPLQKEETVDQIFDNIYQNMEVEPAESVYEMDFQEEQPIEETSKTR